MKDRRDADMERVQATMGPPKEMKPFFWGAVPGRTPASQGSTKPTPAGVIYTFKNW